MISDNYRVWGLRYWLPNSGSCEAQVILSQSYCSQCCQGTTTANTQYKLVIFMTAVLPAGGTAAVRVVSALDVLQLLLLLLLLRLRLRVRVRLRATATATATATTTGCCYGTATTTTTTTTTTAAAITLLLVLLQALLILLRATGCSC